jgi:alanine racemase
MQFETTLIAVKPIRKGERVGYGGAWEAPEDTVLGIVAAGYGDGYTRFLPSGTPVLVAGRRTTLAGRISMDMAAVNLGPGATEQPGAPVTLWGRDLPVEEVAAHAGTIPYQLVCGVTSRARRIAID